MNQEGECCRLCLAPPHGSLVKGGVRACLELLPSGSRVHPSLPPYTDGTVLNPVGD